MSSGERASSFLRHLPLPAPSVVPDAVLEAEATAVNKKSLVLKEQEIDK